jgi:hypothetical protein
MYQLARLSTKSGRILVAAMPRVNPSMEQREALLLFRERPIAHWTRS